MEHLSDALSKIQRNIEIVGADKATRYGFTQVPNFVLISKDLSPGAKLAYSMLLRYAWHLDFSFPGQTKLAEDIGVGERSVRTYLNELEKAKFLEIVQRGRGKTNIYKLFDKLNEQDGAKKWMEKHGEAAKGWLAALPKECAAS